MEVTKKKGAKIIRIFFRPSRLCIKSHVPSQQSFISFKIIRGSKMRPESFIDGITTIIRENIRGLREQLFLI
jgi:hypothetical protein